MFPNHYDRSLHTLRKRQQQQTRGNPALTVLLCPFQLSPWQRTRRHAFCVWAKKDGLRAVYFVLWAFPSCWLGDSSALAPHVLQLHRELKWSILLISKFPICLTSRCALILSPILLSEDPEACAAAYTTILQYILIDQLQSGAPCPVLRNPVALVTQFASLHPTSVS